MHSEDIDACEKFLFTLEWLLAVKKRYLEQIDFALAHIRYRHPTVLGDAYGAAMASQKLDEFSHALRKAFRKTDLVARDGMDFWVLVPYTPVNERLVDKIRYITETASQSGLQIVARDISVFQLSRELIESGEEATARKFLKRLKKDHVALSRQEVSLPYLVEPIRMESVGDAGSPVGW